MTDSPGSQSIAATKSSNYVFPERPSRPTLARSRPIIVWSASEVNGETRVPTVLPGRDRGQENLPGEPVGLSDPMEFFPPRYPGMP